MSDTLKHFYESVATYAKDSTVVYNNVSQSQDATIWQNNIPLYILIGVVIAVVSGLIVAIITNKIVINHRTVTISHKTKEYVSKYIEGIVSFDYSNNNGRYIIGKGEYRFTTCWSKASDVCIHAYSDAEDIMCIGIVKNVSDVKQLKEIDTDYSSRCRTAHIGDVIIWRNINGHIAATKILTIKDDSRKDDVDELSFEYVIFE